MKKTLLIIDDDQEIVGIVREEAEKLFIKTVTFLPLSRVKSEINEELSDLCKERTFDFALLDFELWSGLKGYDLAGTLVRNKIRFIAFSSSHERNALLVRCGAISSIQKDYNSRGLDRQKVANGLAQLLKI